MSRKKKTGHNRKKIMLSFYMLLILFTMITVSTYTWFSISRTPRVSDMNIYINSGTRMELATNLESPDWTLQLDLQDLMPASTPLRPVTWVEEEQCFYAAAYGVDGRVLDRAFWHRLNDQRNANKDNLEGYYLKLTIFARATSAVHVSLSQAVEVDKGIYGAGTFVIGKPMWNPVLLAHDNLGLGAEMAMRVGIRVTPVDHFGAPTGEKSVFYIYEPNSDSHIDGSTGYVDTPNFNHAPQLIDPEHLIRQSSSFWTESFPVQRDVVVKDLGEFRDDTHLFDLNSGQIVQLDIYIWLEGQDIDCVPQIRKAHILACLQFDADPIGGSGLIPIE